MQTYRRVVMATLGVATCLAGCASTSGARSEPTAGAADGRCPMLVLGTRVESTGVDGAAAMVFTTYTGDVAELRRRVREMADMHNHDSDANGASDHEMPGEGNVTLGGGWMLGGSEVMFGGGSVMTVRGATQSERTSMPVAIAVAYDIESGSRLVLWPKDTADLEALREHARAQVNRLAHGECSTVSSLDT